MSLHCLKNHAHVKIELLLSETWAIRCKLYDVRSQNEMGQCVFFFLIGLDFREMDFLRRDHGYRGITGQTEDLLFVLD